MNEWKKIGPCQFVLPQTGEMRVPGLVIAAEKTLAEEGMQRPLEQVRNVAHLPGIIGYSIAMPDIHWGYGFPIGGVAATDAETGVISPGGVGYDINCGVRLATIPIPYASLNASTKESLLKKIFESVPSGVGSICKKEPALSDRDYQEIVQQGAKWSLEQGYGLPEDLLHTESHGCIPGGDLNAVSKRARERGKEQLGTVGSGNHFVEIGAIQQLFDQDVAQQWGVEEGHIYILIHSGSRGFGHQICQDTLDRFVKEGLAKDLPDKQLMAAPLRSELGQTYFHAMAAAANYAFNNRQRILHGVREAFHGVLNIPHSDICLLYDVCHNIAKIEEYTVDQKLQKLCVHRKGATRAFGKNHPELAPLFQPTGQPVLVPGDMGRASYLLVGLGNPITWCSCCHGAGRARSRHQSLAMWKGKNPITAMQKQGVQVLATSSRTILEEMPDAYKDVDAVVQTVEQAGLANRVARLKPHLVIKG